MNIRILICFLLIINVCFGQSTSKNLSSKDIIEIAFGNWLRKEYQEAIGNYTIAIELEPDNASCYNSRAGVKYDLKDFSGAMQDYNTAINLDSKNPNHYSSRGSLKQILEDYRGAIEDYNRAIELNANVLIFDVYLSRGNCFLTLSKVEETRKQLLNNAITDYNMSIEKSIDKQYAYYNRGLAKILLSDKEGGCSDLSKAGELGFTEAYNSIKEYCNE